MKLLILGIILLLFALIAFSENVTIVNPTNKPVTMQVVGFRAATFDPSTITGLKLWLKADTITGKSDGDPVSAWNDSSGNAYNMLASGLNPPNYRANIVNGKPIVRFVAALQNTMVGGSSTGISQPNTYFVVAKPVATLTNKFVVTSGVQSLGINSDNSVFLFSGSGIVNAGVLDHTLAFHVFTLVFNSSTSSLYRDGTSLGTGNPGGNAVGTIGIMSDTAGGGSNFYGGDMAELLLYNSALSTTDRQNVENYLKAKYAIP